MDAMPVSEDHLAITGGCGDSLVSSLAVPVPSSPDANSEDVASQQDSDSVREQAFDSARGREFDARTEVDEREPPVDLTLASRKRKRDVLHEARAYKKKRAPRFDYVRLLNSEIEDASGLKFCRENGSYASQKDGGVTWSSSEKTVFFHQLARSRQNVPRGLAKELESKSDLEILDFQYLLKRKLFERETRRRPLDFVSATTDQPALEIGQSCCKALEEAADDVASFQWRYERQEEEKRFGKHGLLTKIHVEELERLSAAINEPGDPPQQHGFPSRPSEGLKEAVSLLRLENWLDLSERIFMNLPILDEAQSESMITDDVDPPSIFATAFMDFYNLSVSITKRLISTTLFYTMSRLRATDTRDGSGRKMLVKKRDVLTTLEILGMKSNSRSFWCGAARRLGLEVYQTRAPQWKNRHGGYYRYDEEKMPYDAVEKSLWGIALDTKFDISKDPSRKQHNIDPVEYGSTSDSDDEGKELNQQSRADKTDRNAALEEKCEEYLEAWDCRASSMEENRLWNIMASSSATDLELQDTNTSLDEPKAPRKDCEALKDWRDRVDFRADWERYGKCLPQGSFNAPTDDRLAASS